MTFPIVPLLVAAFLMLASCSRASVRSAKADASADGSGAQVRREKAFGLETMRDGLPSFRVSAAAEQALSIVVPHDTTPEQLRKLIVRFKTARARGRLSDLIPPTTPRGKKGPYAIVQVFVFKDEEWATQKRLERAMMAGFSDGKFSKQFDKHTCATYLYTIVSGPTEIGVLGSIDGATDGNKLFWTGT